MPAPSGVFLLLLVLCGGVLNAAKTLEFYFIDVEEGNATLIVSPSGESLLVDTGSRGPGGRNVDRILAAARAAGIRQIDYLLITHYHDDHYGAAPELVERLPVLHFLDHGSSVEAGRDAKWAEHWQIGTNDRLYAAYLKARSRGQYSVAKPGDRIPIQGVDVLVLTAAGERISRAVEGGGTRNPYCGSAGLRAEDGTEDGQSVGILVSFGKFRFIHLGDLTWNLSHGFFCPSNPVGTVDVYLSTHHGMSISRETSEIRWGRSCCPEAEVYALRPRVAILNCGENYHRLGTPRAWQVIRKSPGLEDLWQMHYQAQGGKENNVAERFIANLSARNCAGHPIRLSAEPSGRFSVTNTRNGLTRWYQPR
jgi:beta-lactamase superfamily II metal-dependent hydrolase